MNKFITTMLFTGATAMFGQTPITACGPLTAGTYSLTQDVGNLGADADCITATGGGNVNILCDGVHTISASPTRNAIYYNGPGGLIRYCKTSDDSVVSIWNAASATAIYLTDGVSLRGRVYAFDSSNFSVYGSGSTTNKSTLIAPLRVIRNVWNPPINNIVLQNFDIDLSAYQPSSGVDYALTLSNIDGSPQNTQLYNIHIWGQAQGITDDGIMQANSNGVYMSNITVENTYDCGIEFLGENKFSQINGARLIQTSPNGFKIGGGMCSYFYGSFVNPNWQNIDADGAFDFWVGDRQALDPSKQYYFTNATIKNNIFRSGARFDYLNDRSVVPWRPLNAFVNNNVITGNDFRATPGHPTTYGVWFDSPQFSYQPHFGVFIDGGNNKCDPSAMIPAPNVPFVCNP